MTHKSETDTGDPAVQLDDYDESALALADGGRYLLPEPGTIVGDRDGDGSSGDELVVLEVYHETSAEDKYIPSLDATVADVNEDYPRDAPVVTAAYLDEVEMVLEGVSDLEDVRAAAESGDLGTYDFPAPRLERGGGGDASDV